MFTSRQIELFWNFSSTVFVEPQNPLLQVVALCQAPFLLDDPNVGLLFPADAIAKAKHYLSLTSGGLGILFNEPFVFFYCKKENELS